MKIRVFRWKEPASNIKEFSPYEEVEVKDGGVYYVSEKAADNVGFQIDSLGSEILYEQVNPDTRKCHLVWWCRWWGPIWFKKRISFTLVAWWGNCPQGAIVV